MKTSIRRTCVAASLPNTPSRTGNAAILRRSALKQTLSAVGAAVVATSAEAAAPVEWAGPEDRTRPDRNRQPGPDPRRASPKRYAMKKAINLWAFPYPDRMLGRMG